MANRPADRQTASGRVSQTAPETKSLSSAVWENLEAQPGFSEAIAQGQREIAQGRSVRLSEVRRRR